MQLISGLVALMAALPITEAAQALITNKCDVDVYLWTIDNVRRTPAPITLKAKTGTYSETYHTLSQGGVSLKLSKTPDLTHDKITQFEYTLIGGFIWYDGSNVNCRGANCPFYKEGIYMDTSDPACPTRTCQPNQDCTGFYIEYNDDINTLACRPDADVRFTLCPNGGGSSGSGSAPAVGAGTTPQASASTAATVAAPSQVSVASAVASANVRMEAVTPMKNRKHDDDSKKRFVKKIKARKAEIDARDLHSHMRRHNHKRH